MDSLVKEPIPNKSDLRLLIVSFQIKEFCMGIFDSDWQRLHKKISRQYELIALRNFESGLSPATSIFKAQ